MRSSSASCVPAAELDSSLVPDEITGLGSSPNSSTPYGSAWLSGGSRGRDLHASDGSRVVLVLVVGVVLVGVVDLGMSVSMSTSSRSSSGASRSSIDSGIGVRSSPAPRGRWPLAASLRDPLVREPLHGLLLAAASLAGPCRGLLAGAFFATFLAAAGASTVVASSATVDHTAVVVLHPRGIGGCRTTFRSWLTKCRGRLGPPLNRA